MQSVREEAVSLAHSLLQADDQARWSAVDELLRRRELSKGVHGLNELLRDPKYHDLGRHALRSIGFDA